MTACMCAAEVMWARQVLVYGFTCAHCVACTWVTLCVHMHMRREARTRICMRHALTRPSACSRYRLLRALTSVTPTHPDTLEPCQPPDETANFRVPATIPLAPPTACRHAWVGLLGWPSGHRHQLVQLEHSGASSLQAAGPTCQRKGAKPGTVGDTSTAST